MSLFDGDMYSSPWHIYTSEDAVGSLLVLSGGVGAVYLKNDDTGDDVKVRFHVFGMNVGKSLPVNLDWSSKSNPSSGVGQIGVRKGRVMWGDDFAGRGFILQLGASESALLTKDAVLGGPPLIDLGGGTTAVSLSILYFGFPPFHKAMGKMWGKSNALTPSAGAAALLTTFYVDD